jgi:hypothetical protein
LRRVTKPKERCEKQVAKEQRERAIGDIRPLSFPSLPSLISYRPQGALQFHTSFLNIDISHLCGYEIQKKRDRREEEEEEEKGEPFSFFHRSLSSLSNSLS